jgi:colanic acid biosynthesis glycosyl transferase WcaI
MHIMIMAQCYAPEDVSAAVLITELATDLVNKGHTVTMVTGAPNYPYGKVYSGYKNHLYKVENLEGVRVVRTWSYISPKKSNIPRTLHYGTYSLTAFYGAVLAGRPDILVSFSPPLPLGITAWLLSRLWRVPWVLQLEDLFPDAAIAAGVLKNKALINFFTAMEQFQYQRAEHISLISNSFRRNLLNKAVPGEKITLIPVWADPELVYEMPKENGFRKRHSLTGKFVVMYAGNLGLTSSLEDVMQAAKSLKDEKDICFVIVGEGVKKADMQQFARDENLENVKFLPFQPRELFAEMMTAADLHFVTLNQNSSLSSLPSKTFNIMASSRPILAVAPVACEL